MRPLLALFVLLAVSGCRTRDFDDDGVAGAEDCEPLDPSVYPGADEICDGKDNDCNGSADDGSSGTTFFTDADGDGFGTEDDPLDACTAPEGYADVAGDCDDDAEAVNPLADEVCDDVDNDCDGTVDGAAATGGSTFFVDADGDGQGNPEVSTLACTAPDGWVADQSDCDDGDEMIHVGADELCDGADNDCDDDVDEDAVDEPTWYADNDGDDYGTDASTAVACTPPQGFVGASGDCDDEDPNVHPNAFESCGGPDRSCDGEPGICVSCLDILESDQSTGTGLYTIDPDGNPGAILPVEVYCDMDTDGGGWTLVQRTVWDWSENEALWTDYATWYGSTLGNAAVGSAHRLAGRTWEFLNERGDHLVVPSIRTDEGATCDPLYYEATDGLLDVTLTATTLTGLNQGFPLIGGTELSVPGDGPSLCSSTDFHMTLPWFLGTNPCCSTCPAIKSSQWSDDPHPSVDYSWRPDLFGSTRDDVCTDVAGTALRSENGSHFGATSLEYYLR